MNLKELHAFTDIDLDGTGSLIALHWGHGLKPGEADFRASTVSEFRKEYLKWAADNSLNDYKFNYFLDLDTSASADLIDVPDRGVHIIDHHLSHVETAKTGVYKNAKTNIVETTSCVKVCYKHFQLGDKLTHAQKYFIALVDDYDCYRFKLEESYDLNCLFNRTQRKLEKTRQHKFLERFYNGFDGFTDQEKNIIKEYKAERDKVINSLAPFGGKINISKQECKVVGVIANKFINEVCDFLIQTYSADIVFVMNPNNKHVSWRKNNKTCKVDLSKLAEKVSDGGGHEYAAGGHATETFLEFTKQLAPIGN